MEKDPMYLLLKRTNMWIFFMNFPGVVGASTKTSLLTFICTKTLKMVFKSFKLIKEYRSAKISKDKITFTTISFLIFMQIMSVIMVPIDLLDIFHRVHNIDTTIEYGLRMGVEVLTFLLPSIISPFFGLSFPPVMTQLKYKLKPVRLWFRFIFIIITFGLMITSWVYMFNFLFSL